MSTSTPGASAVGTSPAGTVHVQTRDSIGWIVIDNEARCNAVSVRMMRAVHRALISFDEDPDVAVVVLRGAGDVAFASGVDISEFEAQLASESARREFDATAAAVFDVLRTMTTPSIAMISGYCIGGGLAIALAADIRVAAEGSVYAIPAARLGLGYPIANTEALVQIVGPAVASEILFTGRRLDADEALAVGLVNRIVPLVDLETQVLELARSIAANASLTITAAKAAIHAATRPEDPDLRSVATDAVSRCAASSDFAEGQRAFMEKRTPRFTGG